MQEKHPSPLPFTFAERHPVSQSPLPPHGADVAPGHLAEAEEEPLPDHPGQLVLGDGYKAERLVETDQLQGRVHVQHIMPAGIDQCLHDEPGEAAPAELFKGENTVDFMPVRMKPAPRYRGKRPVDKCAEYAVFIGVGLLLVIVVPDLFDEGEFGYGEFAVDGGVQVELLPDLETGS